MSITEKKRQSAQAAIEYIQSGDIVGVGTGSTVTYFIAELAKIKARIDGTVASSEATKKQLEQHNIPVYSLNDTGNLPIYIDGTDEVDPHLHLIKGGGGALTQEKIIAQASDQFVCIADESKLVKMLGKFPLPIEIIPMARSMVARKLAALGGVPELRLNQSLKEAFITDDGNIIVDVRGLDMLNPIALEEQINQFPGVVTIGLFARRSADILLISYDDEVKTLLPTTTEGNEPCFKKNL